MNEQREKLVIFLGAGASRSSSFPRRDTVPLQNEIFQRFFDYYIQDEFNIKKDIKEINEPGSNKDVFNFFQDFWGINTENWNNEHTQYPTFEECIGVLDLAYLKREEYNEYSGKDILNLRNVLIYIISITLYYALKQYRPVHENLISRLKREDSELRSVSFVTTNYDLIIDNSLKLPPHNFEINYGSRGFDSNTGVKLLKIHGSLNWIYCPVCDRIEAKDFEKITHFIFYPGIKCPNCKNSYTYVIVPPTFYKDFSNIYLQEVYKETEKVLRNTDRIF